MDERDATRARLKPFLTWARVSERALAISGGGMRLYFSGEAVPALESLLRALDAGAAPSTQDARELLDALAARGALDLDADDGPDSPLAAALSLYTSAPRAAARRLEDSRALVIGHGVAADAARALLRASGVRVVEEGAFDALLLAEDAPSATGIQEAARRAGDATWTRVTLDGPLAWVGPTVAPGHACHECFRARLLGQTVRPETAPAHEKALAQRPPAAATLPTLAHQAAAIAAHDLVLALSGARAPMLFDRAAEVSAVDGARLHPVLRVIGCVGCGGP